MKSFFFFVFLALFLLGCGEGDKSSSAQSENDIDAAHNFIRSALDGKYKQARKLVLADSANLQLMDNIERSNTQSLSAEQQRSYRESQIVVHNTRNLGDSASVIVYSNTYMKKQDSLKVVRKDGQWLVDLKYTFLQRKELQP